MRRTYDWKSPPQKVATYQQTIPNQTMYAPRPSNSTQAPPPRGSENYLLWMWRKRDMA